MADSTLAAIRKKVRLLTRNPSEQQISTADIDEYINTFVLYDLPQEVRLFKSKDTLTFYTEPGIDTYESNATVDDPLENFENKYTAVLNPIYIAGYQARLYQSEGEFYNSWPFINAEEVVDSGDGAQVAFTGTLSSVPVLRNKVTFGATDLNGDALHIYDDGVGLLEGDGIGTIDYLTGAYSILFTTAPGSGEDITAMTWPYTAGRPTSVLYFTNKFILRPVPDKVYPVQVEVYIRPTELLAVGQSPDLEQWWQYIAYGAAKKVFEDRTDTDSIQEITPEFNKQQRLVLRRTLVQQSKQRTATPYSSALDFGNGNFRR